MEVALLAGNDTIYGQEQGNNLINGEAGNDVIYGGQGYNSISGGSGDDTIIGGIYVNAYYGNDGNDKLVAGDHDKLVGGQGDDQLISGPGDDVLKGVLATTYLFSKISSRENPVAGLTTKSFDLMTGTSSTSAVPPLSIRCQT